MARTHYTLTLYPALLSSVLRVSLHLLPIQMHLLLCVCIVVFLLEGRLVLQDGLVLLVSTFCNYVRSLVGPQILFLMNDESGPRGALFACPRRTEQDTR